MADVPHYCAACGEIHGGHSGDSEAIKIAKIEAERDIEVARLQRSEARQAIEAETEQTHIAADAQVDAAVVTADVLTDLATPPAPAEPAPADDEPVVIDAPEIVSEPVAGPPELPEEDHKPGNKKKGYWDSYA